MRCLLALLLLACAAGPVVSGPPSIPGFKLPAGFVVSGFVGDALAHDIYTMTIDDKGRVFVAGRGYIRMLVDDNGDGAADRAIDVADHPKDGAMGLLVEGDTLFAVGDGALRRFKLGPDGRSLGPSEKLVTVKTGGEHTAHAIRRGPDGWLYLICGDGAGVKLPSLPPVRMPVGGFMLRFSPDFARCEIVADGFRNPYDFDFTADGEPITFDSDNERCIGLPWYEGCRLYHIFPGGHYGWQAPQHATTWRMPPYVTDVVGPIADLGRGSPTGVACYRHKQFPEKYRGGAFLADWTFGRIWFAPLVVQGATYASKPEPFLESTGDLGLAPTGLAVHPLNGDLYVAIGGRGTRGAVYRICHTAGERTGFATPSLPIVSSTFAARRTIEALARDQSRFADLVLAQFAQSASDPDPVIRRTALRLRPVLKRLDFLEFQKSRGLTTLGYRLLEDGQASFDDLFRAAFGRFDLPREERLDIVRGQQRYFGDIGSAESKGTVFEGYTPRDIELLKTRDKRILDGARASFPYGDLTIDREVGRLFAMAADDDGVMVQRVAQMLNGSLSPPDDIHFLIVLARLRGQRSRSITSHTAATLLELDRRFEAEQLPRDRHWPLRIAELHAELSRKDANLNRAIVEAGDFARPGNVVLTHAPRFDRKRAAERYLDRAKHDPKFAWNAELVGLLGAVSSEVRQPWLDHLWERGGFESALLPILALEPREADRTKFADGLRSPQRDVTEACLKGLETLPASKEADDVLPLVRALRSLTESKANVKLRDRLVALLQRSTAQSIGPDRATWTDWFARAHPDHAAKLGGPDGVDAAAWHKRFDGVDWSQGDAGRGKIVFDKASCATCHSGGSALGPDLRGSASRLSRGDLLTAIVDPNRDIAPQYRSVQLVTTDGKVHQGLVVYEATDGVMLQTGATTTVRIAGSAIDSRSAADVSLMPSGLFDKLSDREIADLLAFMRGLK